MRETFASYSPSKFSIDISKLKQDEKGFLPSSYPAFVHEYCHYIQDITQISSIFGFSLWLRDICFLSQIFRNGEKNIIEIPLRKDPLGESYGKFRKFYLLYCGTGELERDLEIEKTSIETITTELKDISLDGEIRKLAINKIYFKKGITNSYHFGLIPLQEIQSFYAQQIWEQKVGNVEFDITSTSMMTLPYKLGDILFEYYKINAAIQTKFLITDLCLDSIQAPTIFLATLEKLKGLSLSWEKDKKLIIDTINEQNQIYAFSKETALSNIIPDLENWAIDQPDTYLSKAISWYLRMIKSTIELKGCSPIFFSFTFLMNIKDFRTLTDTFPPPIIKNNKIYYRYHDKENLIQDKVYDELFDSASAIWMHWVLYDLLTSRTVEEINNKSCCPLVENCEYIIQYETDYYCKTAPWTLVKENPDKLVCPYSMAVHSFGLWQNELRITVK